MGVGNRDFANRGSMTQDVERDCLENIQEEALDRKLNTQEDFQNLLQIEELQLKSEESKVDSRHDDPQRGSSSKNFNEPASVNPIMQTPTISAGDRNDNSSQPNQAQTFIFKDNSQSGSSRPVYYHESIIERSNDEEDRSQMCAMPSYSALEKSQSQ